MARPKEAILSRNLIRDQALAIIDEDGLDGLTMRRLATRLGVQAASLYTHFANKDAVLDAIADRLGRRIDPGGFEAGWQEGLRTWADSYYTAIHWHPNAALVVAAGARGGSEHQTMLDAVHDGMTRHGWPADQAVLVASSVRFLVLGAATTATGQRGADDAPGDPTATAELDRLALTANRASFTLALESLLRGLDPVYDEVRLADGPASGGLPETSTARPIEPASPASPGVRRGRPA